MGAKDLFNHDQQELLGEAELAAKKWDVLIVDDEPEIRQILANYLWETTTNVVIHEAKDGVEALNLLQAKEPQLVLCDVKIPLMNGMEFLKVARGLKKPSLFMMITGYGERNTVLEALHGGAFAFIDKPFNDNKLEQALERAVLFLEFREKAEEDIEVLLKEHSVPEAVIQKVFDSYSSILKEEYVSLSKDNSEVTLDDIWFLEEGHNNKN